MFFSSCLLCSTKHCIRDLRSCKSLSFFKIPSPCFHQSWKTIYHGWIEGHFQLYEDLELQVNFCDTFIIVVKKEIACSDSSSIIFTFFLELLSKRDKRRDWARFRMIFFDVWLFSVVSHPCFCHYSCFTKHLSNSAISQNTRLMEMRFKKYIRNKNSKFWQLQLSKIHFCDDWCLR